MDVKNYAGLFEKVINKMLRRIALSRYMFFFDFGPIYNIYLNRGSQRGRTRP